KLLLAMAQSALAQPQLADVQRHLTRFATVSAETAQSLWLRLQLAAAQDKPAQLHQWGADLVRRFPSSTQAKRYIANDY
ncbi:MAG: type IV pilus biogenesis/stability protein PilW, partial [Aeromonas sp.]